MSRFNRLIIAIAAMVASPVLLQAQNTGTVTGLVTDAATQQPIASAQVVVVGTNIGALTNASGRFLITNAPAGQREIRVVYLGYSQNTQTVNVTAGSSAVADFSLSQTAIEIDAIVVNAVTGQAQRERELGTNVANISVADLEPATVTSLADVLSGRTAGVTLQDVGGTTGSSQKIRIRGANSLSLDNEPLIFIDGVRLSASQGGLGVGGQEPSRLNDINPQDIENIEVLKGPAASALYGTAAANGVLLITTKRGRAGGAQWNAYVESGQLEETTDYRENWLTLQVIGDGNAPVSNPDGSRNTTDYSRCNNLNAAAGSCTQDRTVSFNPLLDSRTTPFSTGNRQTYGVNVSSGNERVTYYLSGQWDDERGVIDYNTVDRFTLRANLDASIRDDLHVTVSSGYSQSALDLNSNDNSIFSPIINGLVGSPYFVAPTAEEPNQVNRANLGFGFNQDDLEKWIFEQDVDRLTLGGTTTYTPLTWLSANLNVGLDLTTRHDFRTLQPDELPIGATFTPGQRTSQRSSTYFYTGTASTTASWTPIEDISSTTTVGANYQRELFERTECFGVGIVRGTSSCGTTSSNFAVDEDFRELITVGGFVQQQFGFGDRFFVSAAIRGDDDSAFGENADLVWYPALSASWVVGEESWFPESDVLSSARVRASYGRSGLRPDFRDALTLYDPVAVTVNGSNEPAVTINSTGNELLNPELIDEYEFGVDLGLLNERLGLELTYFNKESTDALIERDLPPSLGLSGSVFDNLGKIKNTGIEAALFADLVNTDAVGFSLNIAASSLDNEVVALGEGVEPITFNRGQQRHQEGFPAGAFFAPDITYNDANGDGKLTADEVSADGEAVFQGEALPTYSVSVGGDLRISDWLTVTSLFEARGGNKQLNDTERFRCQFNSQQGCSAIGNPNATLEEQAAYIANRVLGDSRAGYMEDADFIKWRELSVTLKAPAALAANVPSLEGISLTMAGRNLGVWTDYTGIDPEVNESGGSSNFTQGEFNTQPPVRYLMFRLNYAF